jgi:microcin C transport system permease protein
MQRVIEIWESMPQMFVLIIVASVFIPSFWTLLFILLLFSWTELTGMVRAAFLRARNFEYVKAARAIGVSNFRIMWRHILPNAMVTTVTFVPFILAGGIVALTALDFLGLGLGQEYPSLGDLVRQGKDNLHAPWIGLSIFVMLSMLLTALIFVGEGVREAMDKRKK